MCEELEVIATVPPVTTDGAVSVITVNTELTLKEKLFGDNEDDE